jgi:hypothetical protein
VAADYYRAMAQIEPRLALPAEAPDTALLTGGELLALVDALRDGTLNAQQQETLHTLRAALVGLVEQAPEAD